MSLQHFSHEHPLVLINEVPKGGDGKEEFVCYGCQEPITGSAYSCRKCNYFLHKKCGELPQGIKHPMHPQHPLTLIPHSPYEGSSCGCDVCGHGGWKWFTYHCSECKFDAHVSCTPLEERTIEHKFHDHPLTFMQREASFFCDACGTEGKDLSYRCTSTTCQFWIHNSCASSKTIIKRNDHNHPLELTYTFPYSLRNFKYDCYICKKKLHPTYWVYYCTSCRYFAHLKCATSSEEPLMLSDSKSEEIIDHDLIHFPMPDEESMVRLRREINDTRIHNCHDYPLVNFEVESNDMKNREILCDACKGPISLPFYTCGQCSFILHTSCCSQLPSKIQHPYHQQHPLKFYGFNQTFNLFFCDCCEKYGTGLSFGCETCEEFWHDVSCATTLLLSTIKHKAHEHPLLQSPVSDTDYLQCTACGDKHYDGIEYGCNTSTCNFHLDYYCAMMLPGTVKHEWDRHPMPLTYPPFAHPDDYFCEICEEQIHPSHWLYHCRKCDQSFHTKCVVRSMDEWSNVKFGLTYKFEHHPHNLTFVRKGKKKSSLCDHCGQRVWKDFPVLECTSCSFQVCVFCAESGHAKKVKFSLMQK